MKQRSFASGWPVASAPFFATHSSGNHNLPATRLDYLVPLCPNSSLTVPLCHSVGVCSSHTPVFAHNSSVSNLTRPGTTLSYLHPLRMSTSRLNQRYHRRHVCFACCPRAAVVLCRRGHIMALLLPACLVQRNGQVRHKLAMLSNRRVLVYCGASSPPASCEEYDCTNNAEDGRKDGRNNKTQCRRQECWSWFHVRCGLRRSWTSLPSTAGCSGSRKYW